VPGGVLLEESFGGYPVRISLEGERPAGEVGEQEGGDPFVVVDQVLFGEPCRREDELVGAGSLHAPIVAS
jgi:hypothetical protein